jgi:hypothetical protein
MVERTHQVRFVGLNQHGRQAGAQTRQRPLQRIFLSSGDQWHIVFVLGPGIVMIRLTLKTVKPKDFVLLVIWSTKNMNADA